MCILIQPFWYHSKEEEVEGRPLLTSSTKTSYTYSSSFNGNKWRCFTVMRSDSASHMQMRVIIDFYCPASSGPASVSLTDGHPDVFLPASYLRDLPRRAMFIKTTPVLLSVCACVCVGHVCEIFKCSTQTATERMYSTVATALSHRLPVVHCGCRCDYISDQTENITGVAFANFTACKRLSRDVRVFRIWNK